MNVEYTTSVDMAYQRVDNGRQKEPFQMPPTRKQLASKVRDARIASGYGVREAAELLGIDKAYYSRIETGQAPLGKHASAVARLYKLNVTELKRMAEQTLGNRLPDFRPYLRAKTDLPEEAVAELDVHFKAVTAKYKEANR
jgi:transcriptional regulator with XRE-family HTH domain